MFGLDSLLVAVLGGLAQGIIDRARDFLRGRDERRNFAERQLLLSTLRREESGLQSEQRRAEQRVRAMTAERQARREHERAAELVKFEAAAAMRGQRTMLRDQRMLERAPFQFDQDQVRRLLDEKLRGGRPVLLIAPFFDDAQRGPQFDVALRRTWESLPWADNLASLAGLFQRPLQQADVDLILIREALQERPAVLIHGDIQAGRRVWTSLLGFGLITGGPDDVLKVNLPKLSLPAVGDGDELLAFQDKLADLCGTVAGVFGDWYQLLRTGQAPQVHRRCEDETVRRSLGVALAGAYDIALARGRLSPAQASLGQARVLAESGLPNAAVAMAGALPPDSLRVSRELRQEVEDIMELAGLPKAPQRSHRPGAPQQSHGAGAPQQSRGPGTRQPGRGPGAPQESSSADSDRTRAEQAADFFLG